MEIIYCLIHLDGGTACKHFSFAHTLSCLWPWYSTKKGEIFLNFRHCGKKYIWPQGFMYYMHSDGLKGPKVHICQYLSRRFQRLPPTVNKFFIPEGLVILWFLWLYCGSVPFRWRYQNAGPSSPCLFQPLCLPSEKSRLEEPEHCWPGSIVLGQPKVFRLWKTTPNWPQIIWPHAVPTIHT